MLSVSLCLQVFVPRRADGDDDPDRLAGYTDPEAPAPVFDALDCFIKSELPPFAVGVYAAYMRNALVGTGAVGLVDALDADVACHYVVFPSPVAHKSPLTRGTAGCTLSVVDRQQSGIDL